MGLLLALIFGTSVEVRTVAKPPIIDGIIDSIWYSADSVFTFKQFEPDHGDDPHYRTVVKFLQDSKNLYILGICYTGEDNPMGSLSSPSDAITIYLDTFLSKTEAYSFGVASTGEKWDGIVLDDGRDFYWEWEGFWFAKAKIYPHKFVVEIKIPFRAIRFKSGIKEWGLQIKRFSVKYREEDYWILPEQTEGLRVSKFGKLVGITPKARGHLIEVYPIGVVRRDSYIDTSYTTPKFSFNTNWNITSDLMLNFTYNPDFAQIEADPYALNLSKYELYLEERRPFFIEAGEVFTPATMGREMGFYTPIEVFYTRRIGKRVPDGSEVPIIMGSKLTLKKTRVETGLLYVITGEIQYNCYGTDTTEPESRWTAFRFKKRFLTNSEIGMIFVERATRINGVFPLNSASRVYELDGALRSSSSQFLYQIVGSDNSYGRGIHFRSGLNMTKNEWFLGGSAYYTGEKFDINETGYQATLPGDRAITMLGGRFKFFKGRKLRLLAYGLMASMDKEKGEIWGKGVGFFLNMNWRTGYGFSINAVYGKTQEMGETFYYKSISFHNWYSNPKARIGGGINLNYFWNYRRGFLAWMGNTNLWGGVSLTDRLGFNLNEENWIEFKENGDFLSFTWRLRPNLTYNFSPYSQVLTSVEFVGAYEPDEDLNEIFEMRLGLRFSFEYRPKSKIYFVINRHYIREGATFKIDQDVIAFKIKWAEPL